MTQDFIGPASRSEVVAPANMPLAGEPPAAAAASAAAAAAAAAQADAANVAFGFPPAEEATAVNAMREIQDVMDQYYLRRRQLLPRSILRRRDYCPTYSRVYIGAGSGAVVHTDPCTGSGTGGGSTGSGTGAAGTGSATGGAVAADSALPVKEEEEDFDANSSRKRKKISTRCVKEEEEHLDAN